MSEGEGGGGGEDVIKTKKWTNDGTTNLTVSREREREREKERLSEFMRWYSCRLHHMIVYHVLFQQ